MTLLPGTPALRRRLAILALVAGGLLVLRTVDRDLPRDQTLIFRTSPELGDAAVRLSVTITRAGDSEPWSGFTLHRGRGDRSAPRHGFRAPNGDYVVTVDFLVSDLESSTTSGSAAPSRAPSEEKRETSSVHRVTLTGGDTVVSIGPRVSE